MEILAAAKDKSTYVVKIDFTDESGDPVVPTSAIWTLADSDGSIINGREDEVITSLATTVYVALSGDDLEAQTFGHAENRRIFVIEGTYLSSLTGGTLPIRSGFEFLLEDLPQV